MKNFTVKTIQEIVFLIALNLGGVAIAKAQDQKPSNSKKVIIEVEVTENGTKSITVIEKHMDQEEVDLELDEMLEDIEVILDEAVNEIDQTDLEIIIRRNGNMEEPMFRRYIMAVPERIDWNEESESRAFLGVMTSKVDKEEAEKLNIDKGVKIDKVVQGSAAEKAGLLQGDIIIELDGKEVNSFNEVATCIHANEPGDAIKIELSRDGEKKKITAELGEHSPRSYSYKFDWDSKGERPPHPPRPPHHDFGLPHFESIIEQHDRKAFLGIVGKSVEKDGCVRLQEVFEGTAAAKMGIKQGDVVQLINGHETKDIKELVDILSEMCIEEEVKIEFERDGKNKKTSGKLMEIDRQIERTSRSKGLKEYVYHIEVSELSFEEIRELNKKSDANLDESNSLKMDHFTVSPNPGNGVFILDMGLASKGDVEVEVYDTNGRSVYKNSLEGDTDIVLERIDITDQQSGMYYISIKQEGKGKISRVIKQ